MRTYRARHRLAHNKWHLDYYYRNKEHALAKMKEYRDRQRREREAKTQHEGVAACEL